MWETRAEITTAAPPEAVWGLWADPARWGEWNEDIDWARLAGPLAVGARARIKFKRSLALTFTITALEPGRRFIDEARLPGVRLGHEHLVEPSDDRTRVTNRLYIDGRMTRLYALLMGRRMRASVQRFVAREAELAEGATHAGVQRGPASGFISRPRS